MNKYHMKYSLVGQSKGSVLQSQQSQMANSVIVIQAECFEPDRASQAAQEEMNRIGRFIDSYLSKSVAPSPVNIFEAIKQEFRDREVEVDYTLAASNGMLGGQTMRYVPDSVPADAVEALQQGNN